MTTHSLLTSRMLAGILIACLYFSIYAATPPGNLHHQGRIAVNGVNYDGTGHFKFALISYDSTETFWDSDGYVGASTPTPTNTISIPVVNGHYSVVLGRDYGMGGIDPDVFIDHSEVKLRIWFKAETAAVFEQLSPDRVIVPSASAISAHTAENLKNGKIEDPSFIGTTDTDPLVFSVNNNFAMRLTDAGIVLGEETNILDAGSINGFVIGGETGYPNRVEGGLNSIILGGASNRVTSPNANAVIVSGYANYIQPSGYSSVILGGGFNKIKENARYSVIIGGWKNDIGSGVSNSLAAGYRANSDHSGTFVWSDESSGDNFVSTGINQFLIRAEGGVGIGTNDPQSALHVAGTITADAFSGSFTGTQVNASTSLGIGTTEPDTLAHIFGGNDPTLKIQSTGTDEISGRLALRQSNESGFDMYYDGRSTQDGLAFEALSGGSSLGVPLYIDLDGQIGMGTTDPQSQLHLASPGSIEILLEADTDNATETDHPSIKFTQDGGVITGGIGFFSGGNDLTIRTEDTAGGINNLRLEPEGGVFFGSLSNNSIINYQTETSEWTAGAHIQGLVEAFTIKNVTSSRTHFLAYDNGWTQIGTEGFKTTIYGDVGTPSDRNLKEDFLSIDTSKILQRLIALPLSTWKFKASEMRRHIGPMAQDFHAAFDSLLDLHSDDTIIAVADTAGVSFAAIQGLHEKMEAENAELRAENAELKDRLSRLESIVETLAAATLSE